MTDARSTSLLVGSRHFATLCCASACGANLGDILSDTLPSPPGLALAIPLTAFAALLVAQRLITRRGEIIFWLAILAVRSAAIMLADFAVDGAHIAPPVAAAGLAGLLAAVAAAAGALSHAAPAGPRRAPDPGALFWLGMLLAGALGTVAADLAGHAFGPAKVGFPIAAAGETLLLVAAMPVGGRMGWPLWRYWPIVALVGAWGTSVGDIAKFLLSPLSSLSLATVLLLCVVLIWRPARANRQPA